MHNHYDVLGLTEVASTNAVKKAYLFGEWHGYNDDVPDSLKIEQLDEAYAQLWKSESISTQNWLRSYHGCRH